MAIERYIVDLFEDVAARTDAALFAREQDPFHVYFDYGHYLEIVKNLTEKSQGVESKLERYPLIWLVMDFVEKRDSSISLKGYYTSLPDVQILIATVTEPNLSTRQRYEQTFKPRLYPIYQEFKNQLVASGHFDVSHADDIPHEKIDRPFWGLQDANGSSKANLFNDHIDAIQLRRMQLSVKTQIC